MARKHLAFWSTFLAVLALDQGTKAWVVANLAEGRDEVVVIPGFLAFIHARNPGAAFGSFTGSPYRYWVFAVFTVIAVGVMLDLYRRLPPASTWHAVALGTLLGGVLGNAIDRARVGTVTDFVKVWTDHPQIASWLESSPLGSNEWPTFNVADAALVIGVGLFLLGLVRDDDEDPLEAPQAEP